MILYVILFVERLPYAFMLCPLRVGVCRLLFCLGKLLDNIPLVHELLILGVVLNVDEDGFPTTMICDNDMIVSY